MNIVVTENNYDSFRIKFEEGVFTFGINERAWIYVTMEQAESQAPDFISETKLLKNAIFKEEYKDGYVIMVDGILADKNGQFIGYPQWTNEVVKNDSIHQYCAYFGYNNLVFNEELQEFKSQTTETI